MGIFDSLFGPSADEVSSASNRGRRQWNPLRRPMYDWEEEAYEKEQAAQRTGEAAAKLKIAEETKKGFLKDKASKSAKATRRSFWEKALGKSMGE